MCAKELRRSVWPCGQCMPCRINRRRIWVSRLLMESTLHDRSWFVTLTYAPEHLPAGGTVVPRDLELWLKRVRKAWGELRFFAVGEYGERTHRPHYHAIIFTRDCLSFPKVVQEAWPWGFVHVGLANVAVMAYCASYTLKKMTSKSDPRLSGRYPEFTRMSRRPGIGADAAPSIAEFVNSEIGSLEFLNKGDVPSEIRLEGQKWPLGRYMRSKIRTGAGYPDKLPYARLRALLAMPMIPREERARKVRASRSRAMSIAARKRDRGVI